MGIAIAKIVDIILLVIKRLQGGTKKYKNITSMQ